MSLLLSPFFSLSWALSPLQLRRAAAMFPRVSVHLPPQGPAVHDSVAAVLVRKNDNYRLPDAPRVISPPSHLFAQVVGSKLALQARRAGVRSLSTPGAVARTRRVPTEHCIQCVFRVASHQLAYRSLLLTSLFPFSRLARPLRHCGSGCGALHSESAGWHGQHGAAAAALSRHGGAVHRRPWPG